MCGQAATERVCMARNCGGAAGGPWYRSFMRHGIGERMKERHGSRPVTSSKNLILSSLQTYIPKIKYWLDFRMLDLSFCN